MKAEDVQRTIERALVVAGLFSIKMDDLKPAGFVRASMSIPFFLNPISSRAYPSRIKLLKRNGLS